MNNIGASAAKTTGNIAQKAARQIAGEPFEILKKGAAQISGLETKPQTNDGSEPKIAESLKVNQEEERLVKERDSRRLQALESEMLEIRRLRIVKELQERITSGEQVYLVNYPELSYEQRDVLKAQIAAVAARKLQEGVGKETLAEPKSKPSRRFLGFGVGKTQAQRQQTRVEKPLPPSG